MPPEPVVVAAPEPPPPAAPIPGAWATLGGGLDLSLSANRQLRGASVYIGLLTLALVGPFVIIVLAFAAAQGGFTGWLEDALLGIEPDLLPVDDSVAVPPGQRVLRGPHRVLRHRRQEADHCSRTERFFFFFFSCTSFRLVLLGERSADRQRRLVAVGDEAGRDGQREIPLGLVHVVGDVVRADRAGAGIVLADGADPADTRHPQQQRQRQRGLVERGEDQRPIEALPGCVPPTPPPPRLQRRCDRDRPRRLEFEDGVPPPAASVPPHPDRGPPAS